MNKEKIVKYIFISAAALVPLSILVTHFYEDDNVMRAKAVADMDYELCLNIEASFIRKGCLQDIVKRIKFKESCDKKNSQGTTKKVCGQYIFLPSIEKREKLYNLLSK